MEMGGSYKLETFPTAAFSRCEIPLGEAKIQKNKEILRALLRIALLRASLQPDKRSYTKYGSHRMRCDGAWLGRILKYGSK
jgi:hypothetical protein